MKLTLLLTITRAWLALSLSITSDTNATLECPDIDKIQHGFIQEIESDSEAYQKVVTVTCNDGYDLVTPSKIVCEKGTWLRFVQPECEPRCRPPPFIEKGYVETEDGNKDEFGLYKKGTLATYVCDENFQLSPPESKYRVCEKGIWTGPLAACVEKITECRPPKDIVNGYFVHEKYGVFNDYSVGQRLHYSCNSGYVLNGSRVQLCLEDGTWSPKIPPVCGRESTESPKEFSCPPPPRIPHTKIGVFQEIRLDDEVTGVVVKVECAALYRDISAPCGGSNARLQCIKGRWVGSAPNCVPVRDCVPPPRIPYGTPFSLNLITYMSGSSIKYPLKTEISYECLPGYELEGNEVLTCNTNGCWVPDMLPMCRRSADSGYFDVNETNAVLISAATGAGVLALLLVVCLVIVCRRRKPMSRAVALPPPRPRPDLGDHAVLIRQPDRLALIAFAEGLHAQSALPTYEEATRERGFPTRLQRPHWPSLGMRRSRNPDLGHAVTRQGSFASHTPSVRSGADPMGSTDTVAASEGSTTVTLDTASSHSHAASSCRVHCGSLASFDTSSILNTEGVPLLEENELEEVQADNVSLAMDNRSMADNSSVKLSTCSD